MSFSATLRVAAIDRTVVSNFPAWELLLLLEQATSQTLVIGAHNKTLKNDLKFMLPISLRLPQHTVGYSFHRHYVSVGADNGRRTRAALIQLR